jgi:hypothetical protein
MEKLRIAHTVPGATSKLQPPDKITMTPALRAITDPIRRLEAARAVQRVEALKGSTRDFDIREAQRLRAQYPTVFAD